MGHAGEYPQPTDEQKGMAMTTRSAVPESIDEYIEAFPKDVQGKLRQIRKTIRRAAPQAREAIRYQIPTFILHGNLISFAAYSHHIGLYPVPEGSPAFRRKIAAYRAAKSTVRIPLEGPVPYDLISDMVRFRVLETQPQAKVRTARNRK
jgi:uncharacterized protein YdhG (YjbR/CyaY superfamily)